MRTMNIHECIFTKEHILRRIQEFRSIKAKYIRDIIARRSNEKKVKCNIDIREELLDGKYVKRVVIYLPSPGCEWAFWGPGCHMCGHYLAQGYQVTSDDIVEAFAKVFYNIDWSLYLILNLYNNGSFFNDNELPYDARDKILRMISEEKHIRAIVIESRPEYITEDKIKHVVRSLKDKRVEVAVGLESSNDIIRNLFLSKGITLNEFENAIRIINGYAFSRAYVLLKPPFISESLAIKDAITTINYAFSVGVHTVSLEPATIQEGTLLHYLWLHGEYRPPWLWSIIEVIKNTAHLGKLVVGMFQFHPSPIAVPHNCGKCDNLVLEIIKEYNRTLSLKSLKNLPVCDCYKEWLASKDKM